MKPLTDVDREALERLQGMDCTQANLLRELLTISGESYIISRLRTLEARGLIRKEKRGDGNTRTLSITEAGKHALQDNPAPTQGGTV